jgi:hypothetical protein
MKPSKEVFDLLEHVRSWKDMYFEHVTAESVESFVTGFVVACSMAEIPLTWETWNSAAGGRGWQSVATKRPSTVMRERGACEDEIVEELFEILFAAVRRALPEN